MTFDGRESADLGGVPILLFDFWRQSKHWCHTTADRRITFQNQIYVPTAIDMDAIQASQEIRQQTRTITVPHDFAVAEMFRQAPPKDSVNLRVWSLHQGDSDAVVEWTGRVSGVKWTTSVQESVAKLSCDPIYANFRRLGLRLRWCRQCPYALYRDGCGVDPEAHKVVATLNGVSGVTLQSGAFQALPDGRFAGGYVSWTNADGVVDMRTIESHVGTSISVDAGSPDFAQGLTLNAYPGCNKTVPDCKYFNNLPNYGGAPNIPDQSPTDGSIIF